MGTAFASGRPVRERALAKSSRSSQSSSPSVAASTSSSTSTATAGELTQPRGNQAAAEAVGECSGDASMDDTSLQLQLDALEAYDYAGAVELALGHCEEPAGQAWLQAQGPDKVAAAGPGLLDQFWAALPEGGGIEVGVKLSEALGIASISGGEVLSVSWRAGVVDFGASFTITGAVGGDLEALRRLGIDAAWTGGGALTISLGWSLSALDEAGGLLLDVAWALLVDGSFTAALTAAATEIVRLVPTSARVENVLSGSAGGSTSPPDLGLGGDAVDGGVAGSVSASAGWAVGYDAKGSYGEVLVNASATGEPRLVGEVLGLVDFFATAGAAAGTGAGARVRVYGDPATLLTSISDCECVVDLSWGEATEHCEGKPAEIASWIAGLAEVWTGSAGTGAEDEALPEGGLVRSISRPVDDPGLLAPWTPELVGLGGNVSGGVGALGNGLSVATSAKLDATATVDQAAVDAATGGGEACGSGFEVADAIADRALGREAAETGADLEAGVALAQLAPVTLTTSQQGEATVTESAVRAALGDPSGLVGDVAEKLNPGLDLGAGGAETSGALSGKTTQVYDLVQRVEAAELPDLLAAVAA